MCYSCGDNPPSLHFIQVEEYLKWMQGDGGMAGWWEIVATVHAFMSASLSVEIYQKMETEFGSFYRLMQKTPGFLCILAVMHIQALHALL